MANVFDETLRSLEKSARIAQQQVAELNGISYTLDALLSEMNSIRAAQAQGLAIQQAMLTREVVQDKIEEFVYQFEKMIKQFQRPESEFHPSTRFYLLDSVFRDIAAANICTAVIKGRENKAAFEQCVINGVALRRQLTQHAEVREAIAYAEKENKRRLAEEVERQKREAEKALQVTRRQQLETRVQQIKSELSRLERESKGLSFGDWWQTGTKTPVGCGFACCVFYGLPLICYAVYKLALLPMRRQPIEQQIGELQEGLAAAKADLATHMNA